MGTGLASGASEAAEASGIGGIVQAASVRGGRAEEGPHGVLYSAPYARMNPG